MNLLRSRWSTMFVAVLFGCLLFCPAPSRAQTFVELGGGWNYVAPVASVTSSHGSNFRASLGWQVTPNFRWRLDAFTSQFDAKSALSLPCPSFGCAPSAYIHSEQVNGLTVNGLVDVDPRGILYLIGGAGLYDSQLQTGEEWHVGVSAGAGIAVPVAPHLRAVVEARWHGVLGATYGPAWLVPITIGLRY